MNDRYPYNNQYPQSGGVGDDDSDNDAMDDDNDNNNNRSNKKPLHSHSHSAAANATTTPTTNSTIHTKIYGTLRGPAPKGVVLMTNMDSMKSHNRRRTGSTDLSLIAGSDAASVVTDISSSISIGHTIDYADAAPITNKAAQIPSRRNHNDKSSNHNHKKSTFRANKVSRVSNNNNNNIGTSYNTQLHSPRSTASTDHMGSSFSSLNSSSVQQQQQQQQQQQSPIVTNSTIVPPARTPSPTRIQRGSSSSSDIISKKETQKTSTREGRKRTQNSSSSGSGSTRSRRKRRSISPDLSHELEKDEERRRLQFLGEKPPVRSISPPLISVPPTRTLTPEHNSNNSNIIELKEEKDGTPTNNNNNNTNTNNNARGGNFQSRTKYAAKDQAEQSRDYEETQQGQQEQEQRMFDRDQKRMSSITLFSPERKAKQGVLLQAVIQATQNQQQQQQQQHQQQLLQMLREVRMPDCIQVEVEEANIAYVMEDATTTTTTSSSSGGQSITLASPAMMTIPELTISSIPAPNLRRKSGTVKERDYVAKKERIMEIVKHALPTKGDGTTNGGVGRCSTSSRGDSSTQSATSTTTKTAVIGTSHTKGEYGIEQARQEALQYAMYGELVQPPVEMESVTTKTTNYDEDDTTSSSSKQVIMADDYSSSSKVSGEDGGLPPAFDNDRRRLSSITFLSNRAPVAPGEIMPMPRAPNQRPPPPPSYDAKAHQRVTFSGALTPKATPLSSSRKLNNQTKTNDYSKPNNSNNNNNNSSRQIFLPEARMPNCIEVQLDDSNMAYAETQPDRNEKSFPASSSGKSYSTRNGSTVRVNPTPSMVTILESEVSSVPAPSTLERQQEVIVPGAWTIPRRVFRSFVSSSSQQHRNDRGDRSGEQQQQQQQQQQHFDDDASHASRGTVKSLLSATWAIIIPTRRMESVQPIAVKQHTDDERGRMPSSKAMYLICGTLLALGVVMISAFITTLVLAASSSSSDGGTGVTASTMSPDAVSDVPTISPVNNDDDDDDTTSTDDTIRTPNPLLPEKPENTRPPRASTESGKTNNAGLRGSNHHQGGETGGGDESSSSSSGNDQDGIAGFWAG